MKTEAPYTAAGSRQMSEPSFRSGETRAQRLVLAAVAALLITAAAFLPIYHVKLMAPQYPDGLRVVVHGGGMAGDIDEVNELNHYVGMKPFKTSSFPEMILWYPTLGFALAATGVAAWARRSWIRRVARLMVWAVPLGVLADIQFRLYGFGHSLDHRAALRIDPFIPWVIGPTKVFNFTTLAYPGAALVLVALAAATMSHGGRIVRKIRTKHGVVTAALAIALASAIPAGAQEHVHGDMPNDTHQDTSMEQGHDMPMDQGMDGAQADSQAPAPPSDPLSKRIAAARPGDVVRVPAGTYRGPFVVDRSITLEGVGRPILDGGGDGNVLTIRAPGVTIRGFVVKGSGIGPVGGPAGIRVEADRARIQDVEIHDIYVGISAFQTKALKVVGVHIRGRPGPVAMEQHAVAGDTPSDAGTIPSPRGDGIFLVGATDTVVRDTTIDGARDGIYASYAHHAILDRNVIRDSRYGIHFMSSRAPSIVENVLERNRSGCVVMYGGGALLLRNVMNDAASPATGFGLLLKDVEGATVVQNRILRNRIGIQVDGPSGSTPDQTLMRENTVAQNFAGAALLPTASATFTRNSFVDNEIQVLPLGSGVAGKSVWASHGYGNYWSTYRGFDRRGDGFGDLSHVEGGGVTQSVVDAPLLQGFLSSPGLRLLRALQDRWAHIDPVLTDEIPLTRSMSWTGTAENAQAGSAVPARAGALAVVAAVALAIVMLQPRRARVAYRLVRKGTADATR